MHAKIHRNVDEIEPRPEIQKKSQYALKCIRLPQAQSYDYELMFDPVSQFCNQHQRN